MKESRFIELLNLYVDHQLSAAEAPELEAEIANNSARRATYQQYCRIQKACTLLFEQERTQAPASLTLAASLQDANRKIVAFPEQSRGRRGYYPVGLVAAAACAALVFVRFNAPEESAAPRSGGLSIVSHQQEQQPEAIQVVVVPPTVAPSSTSERASFYSLFETRRAQQEAAASSSGSFASDSSVTPVVSYAWMRQVKLEPVQTFTPNQLTLEASSLVSSEDRVLNSRKPVEGATEMTAFTFQR